MPPPMSRPTLASAARASYVDEQKRVAENTGSSASSGSNRAKVHGVPVARLGASNQFDFISQRKRDGPVAGKVRDPDKCGFERYTISDRGSGNYSRGESGKAYDPDQKLREKPMTGRDRPRDKNGSGIDTTFEKGPINYTPMPSKENDNHDNLDFYLNKIRSQPFPGHKKVEMLTRKGDYENGIKNTTLTTSSTVTKDTEHMEASVGSLHKRRDEKHNESHIHNKSKTSADEKLKSCSGELEHGIANLEITLPNANLKFYRNICLSRPAPGFTIVTMLRSKGKYDFFDEYPEFLQWLFPIPESTGRNPEAQPLYEHEAKAIRKDDELSARVLEAFEVMLDYFGMCLVDGFKFKRNKKTYKKRYDNLQSYGVNYMRITRILTSLGELGYEHFQIPWIDFLITEGIDNDMFPTLDWNCISIWIGAIKDDVEKNVMFNRYRSLVGHKASQICEDARMDVGYVGDRQYSGATADGNMNFLSFV